MRTAWVVGLLAGAAGMACAQQVTMSGSLGSSKALLVIDGQPRTVAVGSTVGKVRLISTGPDASVIEIDGRRETLRLGASSVGGGTAGGDGGSRIVLTAGSGGHFLTTGAINGRTTQFVVDTGATSVAMSQAEADRLGIAYRNGRLGQSQTAGGVVTVHIISLASVRVGDVTISNVQAVVVPSPMPFVLLGNSFLSRFQMNRTNDVMTLERRF